MHAIQPKQASMRSGCIVAKSEVILPPTIPTPCLVPGKRGFRQIQRTRFPASISWAVIVRIQNVARIWSPDFWSIWDFVAFGSGIQSHQVLVFPGRPVASTSGISQLDYHNLSLLLATDIFAATTKPR
jgi:hypothetical protein